jgi:CDI immunity proteins
MDDAQLTLDELDGGPWGDPPPGATHLMRTVHALRRRPVGELDVEDLRILLGQRIAPAVLVPLALDVLERDPLAEGDYYPGDLLVALLRTPAEYGIQHPDQAERLDGVLAAVAALGDLEAHDAPPDVIQNAIRAYRAAGPA